MERLVLCAFVIYLIIGIIVATIFLDKPIYDGEPMDVSLRGDRWCGFVAFWPLPLFIIIVERCSKKGETK